MAAFRPSTPEGVRYSEHVRACRSCIDAPLGRGGCARGSTLLRAYQRSLTRVYPPIMDVIKRRSTK